MSIIDRLLSALAPYECLACGAEGGLLCYLCSSQLTSVPERCYRCLAPSAGAFTCSPCTAYSSLDRVFSATAYAGAAKELVSRLKFAGARAAAATMTAQLLPLTASLAPGTIIVPVPTATGRARARGFDQAKLLAHALSKQTNLLYMDCLARRGRSRQVGTSRSQRLHQLQGVFRVTSRTKAYANPILLVDDVITTGATLEAAAEALRARGAGRISAIVFAQALSRVC